MRTVGALSAAGTRAVLMGTGRYAPGSTLPGLPSVDTTLDALERALVDVCGMAAERVHRIPADAGPAEAIAAVEQACADVPGTVLLYFVGHGLLGPRDELYLATGLSMSADSVSAAVPYRTLRDLLGESGSGAAVVLDCCFSGRADSPRGRADSGLTPYRPDGSFLLSSASHYALSFAPDGEPYTRFSGELLELLEEGDPNGPLWLTMDHLYAALAREADSGTRPRRQSDGSLGALVVARNRAYRGNTAPEAVPPADVPCPYPGLEAFRAQD
ncbi:caspase family protein [Streptomyces sp. NPDC056672]|uniref:caspase, EACC1-associated type n=1 Tax=Streptomyces sp. NPDC056672 TaxID=3345906 RepID=UPI0036A735AD